MDRGAQQLWHIPPINKTGIHHYQANQPLLPEEVRWLFAWGLIIVGVLMVVFAELLGIGMVREKLGSNSFRWSPDKAREVSLTIRILGVMCFSAGLLERLGMQISSLKTP